MLANQTLKIIIIHTALSLLVLSVMRGYSTTVQAIALVTLLWLSLKDKISKSITYTSKITMITMWYDEVSRRRIGSRMGRWCCLQQPRL